MATDAISTEEAAQLSGYHPEHIRRLIREGKIKATRKGTMFWIDRKSLKQYLRKATQSLDKRHGPKAR